MAPVPDKHREALNGYPESGIQMQLTPAEQYAGEILSYMLPFVLGQEGRLKGRDAWQTRALDEELDFSRIAAKMEEPGNGKADLLVLDSNLLGLSAVLYHYSRELNQFKGRYIYDSLYPSSELVALRVLLLQKIHRGEKADLGALVDQEASLTDPGLKLSDTDWRATGLTLQEVKTLGAVLKSEPLFSAYLKHPFLVDSFYRVGAVNKDAFVTSKMAAANYDQYPACISAPARRDDRIVIALLPSLTKEFDYGAAAHAAATPYGFKPTSMYTNITAALQNLIVEKTISIMSRNARGFKLSKNTSSLDLSKAQLREIIKQRVLFCVQDKRPLVIYPGNADRVLPGASAGADLNIILLGKDVYLALEIRPEKDIYPHTNRIYLDLMDVKHNQVDDEIDLIGAFIASRLNQDLAASAGPKSGRAGS